MKQVQINLPLFANVEEESVRYRQTKFDESTYLKQYYVNKFIPYIRNIIKENPEITYEQLLQRLKIDVTELGETIFEARDAYNQYLRLLSRNYLMEHSEKIDYYLKLIKSPQYDTFDKIKSSKYKGTFEENILTYLLEIVPTYEADLEDYIIDISAPYYDSIQKQLREGVDPKVIYQRILKQYKKEYNFDFLEAKKFDTALRTVVFGLPEYIKGDEAYLNKDIKKSLIDSISGLNTELTKFGFIEKSKEVRRNQLENLGLSELAEKLAKINPTEEQFRASVGNLSIGNLIAYNVFYTNRYSKESYTLAESLFTAYQFDLLHKMLNPELERFWDLKDKIQNHTETDSSIKYNTDSKSEYPTKEDLYRALRLIYPLEKDYKNFSKRITNLFISRQDSSKVSIPGLIHEIKEIYPTREEFEKGMSEVEKIYPTDEEYELVLDKMAFLHIPITQMMESIQAQIDNDEDSFDQDLTQEDELRIFGNISTNKNTLRYSYEPYAKYLAQKYGTEYARYFQQAGYPIPNIEEDANKYFRFFTPIYYSYEFKDEALTSLLSVIKDSKEFKNAGIIPSEISEDGTTAFLDYIVGIGIDPNLTSAIQVHYTKRNLIDFINQYSSETIFPVYEGMEDFNGISNQIILPISKDIEKYLKNLVKDTSLSPEARRYVSRIYSLATGNVPEHLCTEVSKGNSKKKKYEFKRRYVDVNTGRLYELINGEYVPIEPKPVPVQKQAENTFASKEEDSHEL